MKNVDYQSSNLELDELGPSPEKPRARRSPDGDSDTDFALGPESEADEDSRSTNPDTSDSQVTQNNDQGQAGGDDLTPSKVRQGMAKNLVDPCLCGSKI